jgi:WD40 repeat protein
VLSAGKRDGRVRLSTVQGEPRAAVKAHADGMTAAFVLPDGSRLATAGKDGTVVLWDERAQRLQQLQGPVQRIDVLALSADRAWAAAGLSLGEVWLWNLASGQGRVLGRHKGSLRSLAFSPDSRHLASGDASGELRLWELARGEGRLLHQHQGEVSVVAFSPDSRQLASGSSDHTLWVQSLGSGEGHKQDMSGVGIATLAFTRDGRELFSGSLGAMELIRTDALTMASRGALEDRASSVLYLTFSPEGQRVVTGNFNGTARVWDLLSGESRMLAGHQAPVLWAAFSPDGRYVLSASQDGTVRLWPEELPLEPEELRSWVRDQARR